ncbi:MAG: hypothetical protein C0609_12665 [Deltaproteobacteria bacterium]|nr:MAG: hypothetical protein C0609_12665 [Deltaproteobacteria bacterium]
MNIEIYLDEAQLLLDILESDLRDIKGEIHKTESEEFKQELLEKKDLLVKVTGQICEKCCC